ncbi:hypothetical protein ALP29_200190 [Pseudomonas syringae pv. avii]|uniref:Uncharacterized protein n=1 Tax=Pseudomonas syringae pv. avii TaxID=663959 RepID=A0A3M5U1D4_PSESX|nr:hypothetical protein ALP29_200190 [Pseudomonas syringae pv. avii]
MFDALAAWVFHFREGDGLHFDLASAEINYTAITRHTCRLAFIVVKQRETLATCSYRTTVLLALRNTRRSM